MKIYKLTHPIEIDKLYKMGKLSLNEAGQLIDNWLKSTKEEKEPLLNVN